MCQYLLTKAAGDHNEVVKFDFLLIIFNFSKCRKPGRKNQLKAHSQSHLLHHNPKLNSK